MLQIKCDKGELIMFKRFVCRYCGKEKSWENRDYDTGLYLAKLASFEALGHMQHVTPYLICKQCSKEIKTEIGIKLAGIEVLFDL